MTIHYAHWNAVGIRVAISLRELDSIGLSAVCVCSRRKLNGMKEKMKRTMQSIKWKRAPLKKTGNRCANREKRIALFLHSPHKKCVCPWNTHQNAHIIHYTRTQNGKMNMICGIWSHKKKWQLHMHHGPKGRKNRWNANIQQWINCESGTSKIAKMNACECVFAFVLLWCYA